MQRRDPVGGLIVVLLMMALGASAAGAATPGVSRGCTGAAVLAGDGDVRGAAVARILCHVNRERAARGRAPVRLSRRLSRAAIGHSRDMARHNFFSHVGSDGMNVRQRVGRSGYLRDSSLIAETLAWASAGREAPGRLVRVLMRSPAHKRVLLDGRFRDVGVGLATSLPGAETPDGGATLTLVFGRR